MNSATNIRITAYDLSMQLAFWWRDAPVWGGDSKWHTPCYDARDTS